MISTKLNQDELFALNEKLCDRICELLETLGVEYYNSGRMYAGPCPVHGGDNRTSFNIYGDTGIWKCRTHLCHKKYVGNLIGLTRGILASKEGRPYSFAATIDFLLNFLSLDAKSLSNAKDTERRKYARQINCLNKIRKEVSSRVTRDKVRSHIATPSEYYQQRGYTPEILDKYDVGDCRDPKKRMFSRAVVPIYDDDHKYMAGCTGRSIYDKHHCGYYHDPSSECPTKLIEHYPAEAMKYVKWLDSKALGGFNTKHYLYNYWYAKPHIHDSGIAILVEGAGDVWRLEETGIHISLGMFGTELTDEQQLILERSGAMSLIVITDNDQAGLKAAEKIRQECGRHYRLYFPTLVTNDVGEMSVDKITSDISPIIDEVMGVYNLVKSY